MYKKEITAKVICITSVVIAFVIALECAFVLFSPTYIYEIFLESVFRSYINLSLWSG